MGSVLAAIAAIPEILSFAKSVFAWIQEISKGDVKKWITDLRDTTEKLKQSQTPEEKLDAAKKLHDIIAGL